MKKSKILDWIKYKCGAIAWKVFLWSINMSEEKYWDQIYKQEKERLFKLQLIPKRYSGITTRIVDDLIQQFFKTGSCQAYDHYPTYQARKRVLFLVIGRLMTEHNMTKNDLHIDFSRLIIKKKDELHHNKE
jgi:hypothetical protein